MTKKEKLLIRFLAKPKDFSFDELIMLLKRFGYKELKTGKTGGSRAAFYHDLKEHVIRLHKPHVGKTLKRYQLDYLEEELRNLGLIE